MFREKCSLCGGRLNSQKVCTLCGLDNSKTDKYYRINQSDCDGQPLTHVHAEKPVRSVGQPRPSGRSSVSGGGYQAGRGSASDRGSKVGRSSVPSGNGTVKNRKPKKRRTWSLAATFITLLITVILSMHELVTDTVDNIFDGSYELLGNMGVRSEDSDYVRGDPYELVDEELPAEGVQAEYTLTSGTYIVGVHIPAGNYTAQTVYEYDVVRVTDQERGIYLYEYAGSEDKNYLDDLRLYPGAVVEIESETAVILRTDNGQDISGMDNPVTGGCTITDTVKRAGEDFEAGVYDLEVSEGSGIITVEIYDEDGVEYWDNSLYMGEYYTQGNWYKNLTLPAGAEISCESGMTVEMTPSPVIESTDYMSIYRRTF